jgi:hypothetical protein
VQRPIIDGERWIRERLRFLRSQLENDELDADTRAAVESEIETLSAEKGLTVRGFRSLRGWWRGRPTP